MFFCQSYNCIFEQELSLFRDDSYQYPDSFQLLPPKHELSLNFDERLVDMEPLPSWNDQLDPQNSTDRQELSQEHSCHPEELKVKSIRKSGRKRGCKKGKKGKKIEYSPFHNLQKHLNIALKTILIVPTASPSDQPHKLAARDIWNAYLKTEIYTKRILHYVFNEQNQHSINTPELRNYGLFEIYESFGAGTVRKAKSYLSKLAIDQIDHHNLDGYLQTRKIKKMQQFKDYMMNFKAELEKGSLRKRIARPTELSPHPSHPSHSSH